MVPLTLVFLCRVPWLKFNIPTVADFHVLYSSHGHCNVVFSSSIESGRPSSPAKDKGEMNLRSRIILYIHRKVGWRISIFLLTASHKISRNGPYPSVFPSILRSHFTRWIFLYPPVPRSIWCLETDSIHCHPDSYFEPKLRTQETQCCIFSTRSPGSLSATFLASWLYVMVATLTPLYIPGKPIPGDWCFVQFQTVVRDKTWPPS